MYSNYMNARLALWVCHVKGVNSGNLVLDRPVFIAITIAASSGFTGEYQRLPVCEKHGSQKRPGYSVFDSRTSNRHAHNEHRNYFEQLHLQQRTT